MELLRGSPDEHALRTAALLRRSHPSDKELQLAGLLQDIGRMLRPGDGARHVVLAAQALRPLLGDRVARLVQLHASAAPGGGEGDRPGGDADAVAALRQARETAAAPGPDAGVLEDWRPLLELVAAGSCRAAGNATGPLGPPRGPVTGRR
ncbi:hypothetical protein [Streptomyces sp. NPDC058874]|uniref:hypothetical protein n=1 Tax=unclassified Streptomyces TaxID=2593676 RepID=UPI0036BEBCEB